jgi:hypothetical protein
MKIALTTDGSVIFTEKEKGMDLPFFISVYHIKYLDHFPRAKQMIFFLFRLITNEKRCK